MEHAHIHSLFVIALGALATYLLLPHKHGAIQPKRVRTIGSILGVISLLLFMAFWTAPTYTTQSGSEDLFSKLFFYLFGGSAIFSAILTIASRNPIHSALWFAATVLATCGLFLLAGAQFLAAGTIIVYAGAIIVTFLFVIMLAQMEGRAAYDLASRAPLRATLTSFVLLLGIIWGLYRIASPVELNSVPDLDKRLPPPRDLIKVTKSSRTYAVAALLEKANRPTAQLKDSGGLEKPHVAGLGETLYTDHLVTVELAGALLFAALIGAIAIATPKLPVRPGDRKVVVPEV